MPDDDDETDEFAEPATTPGSRDSDSGADMSAELAENRSPNEPMSAAFAETCGAGGRSSGALPETRSSHERVSAELAETCGAGAHPPTELPEIRSLDESFVRPNAATGAAAAIVADDDPQIRSAAELFFRPTADQETADDRAPATHAEDRSLSEPSSAGRSDPSSPTRDAEERRDRKQRAEDIDYLVSRWELGTVHRLHALAAHHDLDVKEFLVLSELVIRPAGLTASQLIGIIGGGAARMSVLLRGLEKRGLVERDADPFDKRSILVGATDRAREFLPHRPASTLRSYVRQEFSSAERAATVVHFVNIASALAYRSARVLRDGRGLV